MILLLLVWWIVVAVLVFFAAKGGIFSLPSTKDKSSRVFMILTILCWPLILFLALIAVLMEKIEGFKNG